MAESCGACGVGVNEEIEQITRQLLARLDTVRCATLTETYHGAPPAMLCAVCFIATVTMLNEQRRLA